MTGSLVEHYDDRIAGVLSCYDRVVVTGKLPAVCYAAGMTKFLYAIGVRIFDYPRFASTLRDRVRERAASLAAQAGVTIEHIAKSYIRKEAVVAEVLKRRGEHPGLVHVISAMEACGAYQPWHDKQTHKTFVRPDSGKCLRHKASASPPPTMPSFVSMTGNALRIWPTGCRPTGCTWCLTAMPRSAARYSTYSGSPTTGA